MGSTDPAALVTAPAEDVLVFEAQTDGFRLIGGKGRGAGWADIVELRLVDNPTVAHTWKSAMPVRVMSTTPSHVAGPYWATDAVLVPVGHAHLVVFGGPSVREVSDALFVGEAAHVVASTGHVSAEKLLSDELELVHAMRALSNYQPVDVRDTARHIATVAARALSCDVAAVRVQSGDQATLEIVRMGQGDDGEAAPQMAGRDAGDFLQAAASLADPMVEQTVGPDPEVWTQQVVSRMTLPIGPALDLGALSLGHAEGHERGFTSLCQRIGRALAQSAEQLLNQAIAHEQLEMRNADRRMYTIKRQHNGLVPADRPAVGRVAAGPRRRRSDAGLNVGRTEIAPPAPPANKVGGLGARQR